MGQFSKELREGGREERREGEGGREEGEGREGGEGMKQEGREEEKEEEKKEVFNTLVLPETLHAQQDSTHIGLSSYDAERTRECVPLPP